MPNQVKRAFSIFYNFYIGCALMQSNAESNFASSTEITRQGFVHDSVLLHLYFLTVSSALGVDVETLESLHFFFQQASGKLTLRSCIK